MQNEDRYLEWPKFFGGVTFFWLGEGGWGICKSGLISCSYALKLDHADKWKIKHLSITYIKLSIYLSLDT